MSCSTLSFATIAQIDAAKNDPLLRTLLGQELGTRLREIVRNMVPSELRSGIWTAMLFTNAKVVGECATWIGSANRDWQPRALQILVPYDAFCAFLQNMARVTENTMFRFVKPKFFPLASICVEMTFGNHRRLHLMPAMNGPDGMKWTLKSSPYTQYRTWFDPIEAYDAHTTLSRYQVISTTGTVTREDAEEERSFWRGNGWYVCEKGTPHHDEFLRSLNPDDMDEERRMGILEPSDPCDPLL